MKSKKKMLIGICVITVVIVIASILFLNYNEKNAIYEIKISIIEKDSPDRELVVLKNKRKIKFDSVYYLDDVLLCKGTNPTINKNNVKNGEELKIKLRNKKIIKAKVVKEEK